MPFFVMSRIGERGFRVNDKLEHDISAFDFSLLDVLRSEIKLMGPSRELQILTYAFQFLMCAFSAFSNILSPP